MHGGMETRSSVADYGEPDETKPLPKAILMKAVLERVVNATRGYYKATGRGLYMPFGLLRSVLEGLRVDVKGQRHR